jgi:hypothetical protein
MENRKVNRSFVEVSTSGMGEDIRKGCRRESMVEIFCAHV